MNKNRVEPQLTRRLRNGLITSPLINKSKGEFDKTTSKRSPSDLAGAIVEDEVQDDWRKRILDSKEKCLDKINSSTVLKDERLHSVSEVRRSSIKREQFKLDQRVKETSLLHANISLASKYPESSATSVKITEEKDGKERRKTSTTKSDFQPGRVDKLPAHGFSSSVTQPTNAVSKTIDEQSARKGSETKLDQEQLSRILRRKKSERKQSSSMISCAIDNLRNFKKSIILARHLSNYDLVKQIESSSAFSITSDHDLLNPNSQVLSEPVLPINKRSGGAQNNPPSDTLARNHCSTVADLVFGEQRHLAPVALCSSTSSDEEFQSTRCSRRVLEEKFRGLARESPLDDTTHIRKPPTKAKSRCRKKTACNCDRSKSHHKCVTKTRKKTKKHCHYEAVQPSSPDSEELHVQEEEEDVAGQIEPFKSDTAVNSKPGQETSTGDQIEQAQSDRVSQLTSCNPDVCKSFHRTVPCELKIETSSDLKVMSDSAKTSSDGMESRDDGDSYKTLPDTEARNIEEEPPCAPETCNFSKLPLPKSRQKKRKRRKRKRTFCSPLICKIPVKLKELSRQLRMTYVRRAPKLRAKHRSRKRRSTQKKRYLCSCFNEGIYIGSSSETDLWTQTQRKHQLPSFELASSKWKKIEKKKCTGANREVNKCSCLSCGAQTKPWSKFMKRPGALPDIPYILTSSELKKRTQNTINMRKLLRNKYEWPDVNFSTFCEMRNNCERRMVWSNSEKNAHPFEGWCKQNQAHKRRKKEEPLAKDKPGRFGYFVRVKENRLVKDGNLKELQSTTENAVYCQWMQDSADLKVNHFLTNMPSLQTCYPQLKEIDHERRTCYNTKLLERLADLVDFSKDADRQLHEFSFLPKLIKFQEPQLMGDPNSDMPDIKPIRDYCSFPTIYQDLFKDRKHEQRAAMDAVLPPLQWTDSMGFWEMKASIEPDQPEMNKNTIKCLEYNDSLCHAINRKYCAGRYRLHFEAFAEVLRQELLENPERAFLLHRIRQEFLMDLLIYDGGLEMSLVTTTHIWKRVEDNRIVTKKLVRLQNEIDELKLAIKEITANYYEMEKRVEDLGTVREYLEQDEWKLIRRINRHLEAQNESIQSNVMFDLD